MKNARPHILVMFILAFVILTGVHSPLREYLADKRFELFPREASGKTVLVAIDSLSIRELGVWPWPRQSHAQLVRHLVAAGVKEIYFDVDFSSTSNDEADQTLAKALEEAGGSVVLPIFSQSADGRAGSLVHISRPLPALERYSWLGLVNVKPEVDGTVRRYALGDTIGGAFVPSIGALLAGTSGHRQMRIDFSIRAESLPRVSYVDVLRGDPGTLHWLRDQKVIIGATAIELGDRINVPNGKIIAGPELQMLAAETMLSGREIVVTSLAVTILGVVALVLIMALLWRRSALIRVLSLIAASVAIEAVGTVLQVKYAIVLDTSLWQTAIFSYFLAIALDEMDFRSLLRGVAESRFQQIAMSLGDGLICLASDGRIVIWNPGAETIFGYSADEIVGRGLDAVFEPSGKPSDGGLLNSVRLWSGSQYRGKMVELFGRKKSGEIFPIECSFSMWSGVDGLQYGVMVRDVTERKRESDRILYLAEHDTLTGLANRHMLYKELKARMEAVDAYGGELGLLLIDLDRFKEINDCHGHGVGDRLLVDVGSRLSGAIAPSDLVARLSGDEFAVLISASDKPIHAAELANRICASLCEREFMYDSLHLRVNASVGISVYPEHGASIEELFGNADLALYRAKERGRGHAVFFERSIRDEMEARAEMEAALGRAVSEGQLELYYQPQVALKQLELVGAEALIRWHHPQKGLLLPLSFINLLNDSVVSRSIAEWIIERACIQAKRWQDRGYPLRVGVNLAPSLFKFGDLAAVVESILKRTGLNPSLLELEVTENIILEDDQAALNIFKRLKELGISIAFDDFGTGYAGLAYLKRYALDTLKVDKSFVKELGSNSNDAAIVECAINLGRHLGMRLVAEGIEDAETARLLANMGCDEGQGYLFGAAVPASVFEVRHFRKAEISSTAA